MAVSSNEPDGGFSGKSYELNLYLLFLHRGCRNNNYGFKLHREQKDAGKFDDLVFEFVENGSTVYRLLQAKHSVNPGKRISELSLFSGGDGDFDLIKYLVSYRIAKQNYATKGQIKDFVICTSRSFDFKQLKTDIEKITEADSILYLKNEDKESVKYRLKNTKPNFGKIKGEWKKRMSKWIKENDVRKTQQEPHEAEIEEFLNHFIFAVDMPNDTDLGTILKDEIGEEFNEMTRKDIYNRAFQRMIDWMKANDSRNFWTHEDAMAMFENIKLGFTLPYDVRYNVQPPVKRFIGRIEQLEKLDELLQKEKQVMICGFGGVGKTELVREYIKKHSEKYYNNILWIDAEREAGKDDAERNAEKDNALDNSFRGLASGKLKIGTKDANGQEKEISVVIGEVYQWFQQSKSLFVFDNAEWQQYQDYMRPSLPGNVREPYIIVISRVKWQNEDLITRIDLSEFTEPEAIRFISESLPKFLEDDRQGDSVEKLAETLQYLPLALRQATAYINVKFRHETKTYKFSEYVENFSKKSKEYLDYGIPKYCENKYDKTVWTTWDITVEALRSEKNYTSEVLNYMSFLLPNDIHADLLSRFIKEEEKLKETILLLDEYSLITVRESFYSLHRLVQLVTREKLQRDERREVLQRILDIIAEKDDIVARGVDHFTSAWMHFKQSCTEVIEKYYHVPATIAFTLFEIGRYKEAFSLGIESLEFMNNFSFKDEKEREYVQNIAPIIVRFLSNSNQYEMALNKSKEVLTILKDINKRFPYTEPILTIENDIIVICLHMRDAQAAIDFMRVSSFKEAFNEKTIMDQNITMFRREIVADLWSRFFGYEAVVQCYCDLFDERESSSKFSDPDTLRISKKIAKTYYQVHLCEKAIKFSFLIDEKLDFTKDVSSILQKAHEKQKKVLPNNHSDRLDTQEGIISLLIGQGKYEEALALFEDISDESLARNNCSLLTKKATVLAFLNENDRALSICDDLKKDILMLERGDFKKNHPEVVDRCVGVAFALSLLSKFDEALQVLGEVWGRLRYSVSCYNFHVATVLTIVAHIYLMQNKRFEGLSTLDAVRICYNKVSCLHFWMPHALRVFIHLYGDERQLDLALQYGLELMDIYEKLPEIPQQSRWKFKCNIAELYYNKKDYDEALSMLTEVKRQLEIFGKEDDPSYREVCQFMVSINVEKVEDEAKKNKMSTIEDPFEAVKRGNLEQLKKLIEGGTDVNASDENDWTLLHHAASGGKQEILEYLLKNGADTSRVTKKSENTVLHIAVTGNHFDFVELLLNFNYDKSRTIVNAKVKESGNTALHIASQNGLLRMARLLLTYGAAYDVKNQAGESPLDMASGLVVEALLREVHARFQSFSTPWEYGALELFKNNWLQFQAVFNARNDEGDSLFKLAVVHNCRAQVITILDSYMIEHNLGSHIHRDDVLFMSKHDEIMLFELHVERARRVKHVECLNVFYRLLKDIRCICKNYFLTTLEDMSNLLSSAELSPEFETLAMDAVERQLKQLFKMVNCLALLEAARRDDLTAFKLYLDKYPYVYSSDRDGHTALHYAAAAGNVTMVELLLDRHARENVDFSQRGLPLHLAAKNGYVEVARLLLRKQFRINYVKAKGTEETALHLAAKSGHLAMVKLLLEYHAEYGYRNNAGQTPADVAASQEIKDLFALIDELHEDANAEQVLERLSKIEPTERRPLLNAVHPDKKQLWQYLGAKCTDKQKLLDVIGEHIEEDSNLQAELTRKLLGVMLEVNENRDKYF